MLFLCTASHFSAGKSFPVAAIDTFFPFAGCVRRWLSYTVTIVWEFAKANSALVS